MSTDLLLGIVIGVMIVIGFQQGSRFSEKLLKPGCLIPLILFVVSVIAFFALDVPQRILELINF